MTTPTHFDSPVSHFGAPLAHARLAVLLVHGRTQCPADMFKAIASKLALDDVAYIAPLAAGNSWYPARFMEPLAANQPDLDTALARLDQLSADLQAKGFDWGSQVVMGFSQGACLSAEFVWRQQRRYGALMAFTGGLIGPPDTTWSAPGQSFRGMPVYLPNSDVDPWVPLTRSQQTGVVFRAHGAEVTERVFHGMGHEVCDEEIDTARSLLKRLLATQSRSNQVMA